MIRRLLVLPALLALAATTLAADWPQFLGPNRDNSTTETVAAWTGTPKTLWKQPLGDAHSSPVVANGLVYAFFKPKGKDADALAAFDVKTGEKKFEQSYDRAKFTPPFGVGPRGTPSISGGFVYTLGSTGILAKWDAKTGEIAWKVDTLKEFNGKNLFFGISTSPTVIGDQVIVMVGAKDAGIVAFDTATGKTAWKATSDPASYASPLPVGEGKDAALVFLTGSNLRGLSATDGKELWAVPFKDLLNESSTTPVKVNDLIVAGSVTAGSIGTKVESRADGVRTTEIWKNPLLTLYFSTPVAVGDHLYAVTGAATLVNPSVNLRCVETKTGKVVWTQEKVGKYHAAMVRTADNKLLMLDDTGKLALLQPSPDGYKELASAKVCGPTWAHPAISNGVVFLRDDKELIALSLKE